jgi:chromatin remodeling complex protein RSC6
MTTKEKKNSAFMRPVRVSDELAEVIGKGPMPRTEVMKKLWDYIKKHKLQDPQNKRNIIPDQKLSKVFGSTAAINMFKMTSKVSTHLHDNETAASKR